MSEMKVNNLTVDLIQDQAAIALFRQGAGLANGKASTTFVNINVPISAPGNQVESNLRRIAIEQAKSALREAIEVLESYAA